MSIAVRMNFKLVPLATFVALITLAAALVSGGPSKAQFREMVDTALIVSVDVSNSVDAENYQLQMEGIAAALEDPEVIRTIASGPNGAILFALVSWSTETSISLPLTRISNKEEAFAVAQRVRRVPRDWNGGEFTCVEKMFKMLHGSLVPDARGQALRTVIDVSGDGPDNCADSGAVAQARDALVAVRVEINGLPILQAGDEGDDVTVAGWRVNKGRRAFDGRQLEEWYKTNVKGGPGSFIIPAIGFRDFARAIRRKFVIEISGRSAVGGNTQTVSFDAPAGLTR